MKIIIDAMALGAAYANPTGRTGVFRVVDQLVKGIDGRKNCDLSLIATNFSRDANSFLKEQKDYDQHIIYPTNKDRLIEKVRNRTRQLNLWPINRLETNLEKLLKISDVYHSPYMPIPEAVINQHKTKSFLTVHDLIPILHPEYFENNERPLVAVAIESAINEGWFFCVSNSTKNDLCTHYPIDPNRVFVTHLAASRSRFHKIDDQLKIETVKSKYGIAEQPYFLSLCTLEPRKNVDQIIRSFIHLVEQEAIHDLNLVLIGSKGWDFDPIFSAIKNANRFKSRIIVTGFVDDADLAYLYSGAFGFIYPSFYEGFGLPPLEAMQCGLPVVTSNTSSLPEVVGEAGILIDPKDGTALSQQMLNLYQNESLRAELSIKSVKQAEKFSWNNFVEQTIYGYQKSLL